MAKQPTARAPRAAKPAAAPAPAATHDAPPAQEPPQAAPPVEDPAALVGISEPTVVEEPAPIMDEPLVDDGEPVTVSMKVPMSGLRSYEIGDPYTCGPLEAQRLIDADMAEA